MLLLLDNVDWEKEHQKLLETNDSLLKQFEKRLKEIGWPANAVDSHVMAANNYINEYLLHDANRSAEKGVGMLEGYFGEFIYEHWVCGMPGAIGRTALSIEMFYCWMVEQGLVAEQDYNLLRAEIAEKLEAWKTSYGAYLGLDPEKNGWAWD